jgi:hypothetical protein
MGDFIAYIQAGLVEVVHHEDREEHEENKSA